MLRDDIDLVRQMIKEEIAVALKSTIKVATPKPAEPKVEVKVETIAEVPFEKGKRGGLNAKL
jgi:hypothetical protein